MTHALAQVIAYHDATKPDFQAYARGPDHLGWAHRPDPFRRYDGNELRRLTHGLPVSDPDYGIALAEGVLPPAPLGSIGSPVGDPRVLGLPP